MLTIGTGLHTLGAALVAAIAIAPVVAQTQAPAPPPPAVKIGEAAPDFSLPYLVPNDGGGVETRQLRLSDFKGRQHVVVAFFPAAFSPGCTNELKAYQGQSGEFTSANTAIVGVSVDSTWANRAFRDQLGAEFPIVSDWTKDVSRAWGVLDEKTGMARRTTFVIDRDGIVRHIEQGREAVDPSGALTACRLLKKPA